MSNFLYLVAAIFGWRGALLAGGILVSQIIGWLKDGVWTPQTVVDGFAYMQIAPPTTKWIGVQKMIDYILYSCPLSLGIFIGAMFITWLAYILAADAELEERRKRALKESQND